MNLVDSCGWLEYFGDGAQAGFYAPAIEAPAELVVPTVCIVEVCRRMLAQRGPEAALKAAAAMEQGRVIPLDAGTAFAAARIGVEMKLPLADAIIMATAQAFGAEIWTQDEHFRELPGVRFATTAKRRT